MTTNPPPVDLDRLDALDDEWAPVERNRNYIVSSSGLIARITNKRGNEFPYPLILTQKTDRYGYRRVGLWRNQRQICVFVHHLVAEAFVGPRPSPDHQMRHLNNNPSDNRAENLAWGTQLENARDRARAGSMRGERNPMAKLMDDDVRSARARREAGETLASIAASFGVTPQCVSKAIARREC